MLTRVRHADSNGPASEILSTPRQSILQTVQSSKLNVSKSFGPVVSVLDYFDRPRLGNNCEHPAGSLDSDSSQTSCPPKKVAISISVTSKAKFPMKAVYGGLVGNGRSSLGGRSARAEPVTSENMSCRMSTEALTAYVAKTSIRSITET